MNVDQRFLVKVVNVRWSFDYELCVTGYIGTCYLASPKFLSAVFDSPLALIDMNVCMECVYLYRN